VEGQMLVLRHADVREILTGRERETIGVVRDAYRAHDEGQTVIPHSSFLRIPGAGRNRIIALPAFLAGSPGAASSPAPPSAVGIKWIASFPGNISRALPRASAVIVLNSLENGAPVALIEASAISAQRTAASASLAAELLHPAADGGGLTLFGCGVINLEVLRFLALFFPQISRVTLYDVDPHQAARCAGKCADIVPGAEVRIAPGPAAALAAHSLISVATTATAPHLELDACHPAATVLHLSLRDIHPEDIIGCHNIVDDADHVCREHTSLSLAEARTGNRGFISASIGQLVRSTGRFTREPGRRVIFSPFGLGALDIALASHVLAVAVRRGIGERIGGFAPDELDQEEVPAQVTRRGM
jgi:2,3-diaminopropionate biosynthesis protein SbnB